ncbi:MAG: hypothetical protein RBS88_04395 [Spongiibacteraceae bacterium]|jgi:hypothetical protein|nr:hypothetical protein [Spongiibacteraceae bacterium]
MRRLLLGIIGLSLTLPAWSQRPEPEVLPASEYRTSLEEVVVHGARTPAWRDRLEEKPRWDQPRLQMPEMPQRIEWLPAYTREEREDYEQVRDRNVREPRIRLFDIRF